MKLQVQNSLLRVSTAKNNTGSTEGEEGTVSDEATLLGREFDIIDKGTGIAVVVFQGVFQFASFVTTDGDRAMVQIDAGINRLEGAVGRVALLVASYHIVAHTQRDDLLVMKGIFDDDNRTTTGLVGLLVGIFIFLAVAQFTHTDTDAKLLTAVRTLEDERLTGRILGFIKGDVLVALRTTNAFHEWGNLDFHDPGFFETFLFLDAV